MNILQAWELNLHVYVLVLICIFLPAFPALKVGHVDHLLS